MNEIMHLTVDRNDDAYNFTVEKNGEKVYSFKVYLAGTVHNILVYTTM